MASFLLLPTLGAVSGPILARALDAEGRGQYAAILQPVTFAAAFATLGIPSAVAYFISGGSAARRTYRAGLYLAIAPIAITYAAMCAYAKTVASTQHISWVFICLCWLAIPLAGLIQVRRAYWQGLGSWRRLDAERSLFAVARFATVVGLAVVGIRTAGPYAAASLSAFAVAAAILWWSSGDTSIADSGPTVTWRRLRSYSSAASVSAIAGVASSRLDQVLFPAAGSSIELGYYAVAVTVADVPMMLGVLAARNALHHAGSGQSLMEILRELRLFLAVSVAMVVVAAIVSPWLVPLLFGAQFSASVASLEFLLLGTIPGIFALVASSVLIGRGRPGASSIVPLTASATTVVAFAVLWGGMTATWAGLISLASQGVAAACAVLLLLWPSTS